jgi:wyosine [tRNA(Phe)-imidazoG37] synthetase (radical SAM superfamily)
MKYVFGPVPSRRLGQSLGIDPVPLKTCNWNCVYCQLGRSRPLINERLDYFPPKDILAEVKETLKNHKPGEIDWITFVGSGETTLHATVGGLICGVKALTDLPVAVITNGSLLYLPEIRAELSAADAVLPSLDAGNAQLYKKINRPHPETTFKRLVDGLIAFREEYQGKLWIEVMLIRDLNDTEAALKEIALVLQRIQPDEVHIIQPTRPPVETWVQPPDEEGLLRARAIFGDIANIVHPASGSFDLSGNKSLVDAIVGIITRHPMRESELIKTLNLWSPEEINSTLEALANSGKAQTVERYGIRFWSASPSFYPSDKE